MPLKITLKPNEKVIIGSAVVSNGASKAELVIHNRVPVVRQKDVLTEEEADTPAKQIYVLILNMYLNPDQQVRFHDFYEPLLQHIVGMAVDDHGMDLSIEMSRRIIEGDHYKALKICKKIIEHEAETASHVQGQAERVPGHAEAPADDAAAGGSDGLHQGRRDDGGRETDAQG
jgi:flagellar protein FlbT